MVFAERLRERELNLLHHDLELALLGLTEFLQVLLLCYFLLYLSS